jgi:hypothetical protein
MYCCDLACIRRDQGRLLFAGAQNYNSMNGVCVLFDTAGCTGQPPAALFGNNWACTIPAPSGTGCSTSCATGYTGAATASCLNGTWTVNSTCTEAYTCSTLPDVGITLGCPPGWVPHPAGSTLEAVFGCIVASSSGSCSQHWNTSWGSRPQMWMDTVNNGSVQTKICRCSGKGNERTSEGLVLKEVSPGRWDCVSGERSNSSSFGSVKVW